MKRYRFKGIEVKAESAQDAVKQAKEILLDYEVTSMATVIKTPSMSICTTDDEDHIGEPYFKVYTGTQYRNAEKMCRISFLEPRYIKTHSNNNGAKEWVLNSKERKLLIKLLKDKVGQFKSNSEKMTGWEYAISQFNNEKGCQQEKTEKLIMKNPKYMQGKDLLPFNLPMPDYTKL